MNVKDLMPGDVVFWDHEPRYVVTEKPHKPTKQEASLIGTKETELCFGVIYCAITINMLFSFLGLLTPYHSIRAVPEGKLSNTCEVYREGKKIHPKQ